MAVILQTKGRERDYLLRALVQYGEEIKGDPEQADLRAAVLALLMALCEGEPLVITDAGRFYIAEAVLLHASRHGRSTESEALINTLAPLAAARR